MKHCPHCGDSLGGRRPIRNGCGTNLRVARSAATGQACAVCATPIGIGWRHCAACGAETSRATKSTSRRTTIAAQAGAVSVWTRNSKMTAPRTVRPDPEPLVENLHD